MELFTVNGEYVCKARSGFTMQKLENALDDRLAMRKGSFAELYSLKIFRDFFQYARDLRKEYQDYYCEEYDDFPEFLYKKEFWEPLHIQKAALTDEDTILKPQIQKSSYNLDTLLNYDESDERVIDMLVQTLEGIDL